MRTPSMVSSLIVVGATTLLFFGCSLIPYTSTEIQEWRVQVVDSSGTSVAGAETNQTAVFSGRRERWVESRATDAHGRASFPAKTIRASLIDRALVRLKMYKSHYPYGPSAAASASFKAQCAYLEIPRKPNRTIVTIRLELVKGSCPYAPEW